MSRPVLTLIAWTLSLGVAMSAADENKELALKDFDQLWDYNNPAATEEKFRALLPRTEAGDDKSLHVQLLTQIARTQGLQRNFETAHATLDKAESLVSEDMTLARARILLERGRTVNSSGEPKQSIPLFTEALQLARDGGHEFYAVDAAHMLGIVEEPDTALEWNLKAITLAESAEEERARNWLGPLYNNTGWTLHDAGEYEQALDLFEKALAWRQEKGQERETRIAKWCVARCLRSLGRVEESLAMQQDLLAQIEAAGADQDGYVFEELGECLHALGKPDEARPHFEQAYKMLSADPWLQANEKDRLARLKELGGVKD